MCRVIFETLVREKNNLWNNSCSLEICKDRASVWSPSPTQTAGRGRVYFHFRYSGRSGSELTFFMKNWVGTNLFFPYRVGTDFILLSLHGTKYSVPVLSQSVWKSLSRRGYTVKILTFFLHHLTMQQKDKFIYSVGLLKYQ